MYHRMPFIAVTLLAAALPALAQETRGTIQGRVLDPSGAAVVGARIAVENVEMNTTSRLVTNETGYFEATLLLPGGYRVSAEAAGFKKTIRSGLVLPLSGTLELDLALEVGGTTETVSVTAEAPVLETGAVSSGRTLENRSVMDLPVIANNTMVLVKMSPGLFTGGVNDYLGPHSISGASDYSTGTSAGGNEWSIDGVPNNGANRQTAYLPAVDTVQEMRVETSNFDASSGHGTMANVTMMTKAGTNSYHGSLTEQHWQQRWQGTSFFVRQAYYRNIAAAEAAGNTALADNLRSQDMQQAGRSNNYSGSVGGPVRIPKVYNGRDKLFFFFSYQGNKDQVADLASRVNTTIPTMAERTGDFSRYLQIDPVRYQLYDPLSVRVDPARAGHYIRTPISGNILPKARQVNPMIARYLGFLPATNNDTDPRREPTNDYLSSAPLVRDYAAYGGRADYQLSQRHRFFGRYTTNHWANYAGDWTYTTLKGLQSLAQIRRNRGGTVDWVYTINANTVLDVAIAVNEYRDGNDPQVAMQFKPTDYGLPAYLDAKAGDQTILPVVNLSGYNSISTTYPVVTAYRTGASKADLSQIRGNHSLRAGFDLRNQYRTGGGGGNTSGTFNFSNAYVRKNDDTFTPAGNLGLSFAAFLMGIPDSMTIAVNDSYALLNPYYAWYGQDTWRATRKLTLNFGLRLEYEMGPTERYNRLITGFDPAARLPISDGAQAAYAKAPVPELNAADFKVLGGSLYAAAAGGDRKWWKNQLMWMPRVSAAYQLNPKTVVRAGYGIFYDTLNVLNQGPDQTGYSRTTSTIVSNDFGMSWLAGNPAGGIPPVADPFPVRGDGTRFDAPSGSSLGLMGRAGRGWSYLDYNYEHAYVHRWRFGVQHQIGAHMTVEAAYVGERSRNFAIAQVQSPLPAKFWATGTVRDNALASNMTQNVTNPFRITNFADLRVSDPAQYTNMSSLSFFTSANVQKQVLLRAFPHMSGLTRSNPPIGQANTNSLQVIVQRRFAKGFNLNAGYTAMRARVADYFYNEFDAAPSWRKSNDARPHRFTAGGIYELPFGKGRAYLQKGIAGRIAGGFQLAATYEWQPGALLDWGNLFYYGKLEDVSQGTRTLDRWFNTDGFERVASRMPAAYQARVFPTRIDGVTSDMTNQWNVNAQRDFRIHESIVLQLRLDAINLQNRSQFAAPVVNPNSTDFGRVTSQSNTTKRFFQAQIRLRF